MTATKGDDSITFGLLLRAWWLLAKIRVKLMLWGFKSVMRKLPEWSSRLARQAGANERKCINVAAIRRAVYRSNRLQPGDSRCLARALAAKVLLDAYGHSAELKIGVASGSENAIEAHAWIESDNQIVIGERADLERYRPFPLGAFADHKFGARR